MSDEENTVGTRRCFKCGQLNVANPMAAEDTALWVLRNFAGMVRESTNLEVKNWFIGELLNQLAEAQK